MTEYKTSEAQRAKALEHYYANRDEILADRKVFYAENADRLKADRKRYRAENKEKVRATHRRIAGIVDAHGELKHGPCEICGLECKLNLDHDHATGRIRGWLCTRCNQGLGSFKDSPDRLRKAALYLEKTNV